MTGKLKPNRAINWLNKAKRGLRGSRQAACRGQMAAAPHQGRCPPPLAPKPPDSGAGQALSVSAPSCQGGSRLSGFLPFTESSLQSYGEGSIISTI